jgi:hypothetical protein
MASNNKGPPTSHLSWQNTEKSLWFECFNCPLFAGETFISVAQIPPILLHKPLFFSSNPTHCSWFTPFFSKFLAELPSKKQKFHPDTQRLFPPLPV